MSGLYFLALCFIAWVLYLVGDAVYDIRSAVQDIRSRRGLEDWGRDDD